MTGPVVVVTGCSSGIGLAAAVEFASLGCDVIATVRDLDRTAALRDAAAATGTTVEVRRLDVADDRSVGPTIASIVADHGDVDIVISNAGIGIEGTTEELTLDDFRSSFEVNTLGSVRLLHAVLPRWRERRRGRFIAVGSTAGVLGNPFNDAYCASKFALEGLLESLHPVVAQHGVQLSIVEPGPVAGEFAVKHGPPPGREIDGPYAAARARFQAVQDGGYAAAQTNAEIATVLWQIASAEHPWFRYQTSDLVARVVGVKLKDLTGERVTGMTSGWI